MFACSQWAEAVYRLGLVGICAGFFAWITWLASR